MPARLDLQRDFERLEAILEAQPDGTDAEIVLGSLAMSPRPRGKHGVGQGRLFARLDGAVGEHSGDAAADWLFAVEPELRHARTFNRVIPDLAGWRKSTTGWPDLDATPITKMPEWVAEFLSPSTEADDRERKPPAYGLMGVVWLWLVDLDALVIETFTNVRGEMVPAGAFRGPEPVAMPPFETVPIRIATLAPRV